MEDSDRNHSMFLNNKTTKRMYRHCVISVMDTINDPDITFDENGISNYYFEYKEAIQILPQSEKEKQDQLSILIDEIKIAGKGKPYDCILGLSGGVDSSYVAWIAWKHGLRPLVVNFDNGWDSIEAKENVQNIIDRTGFRLHTATVDSEEYRDLQLAYLEASVVDIEAPTDHAVAALLYRVAIENKIGFMLSGTNFQTECTMPKSWNFFKGDDINIKAIHRAYGKIPLKTFPLMNLKERRWLRKQVEKVSILHYVNYNKKQAKEIISRDFGWKDYGAKHFESIWTRFYQGYILPEKFGIDKRKPHLSDLIFAGQITKTDALEELQKPVYQPEQFQSDKSFVLKKLGITEDELSSIMKLPIRSHYDFDYEMPLDKRYPVLKPVKKIYRSLFPVK